MIETIKAWAPLVVLAVQLLILWVGWSMRKEFMTREDCSTRCKKLGDKQTALENKQTALAAAHDSMPNDDDLEDIRTRLGGIEGDLKGMLATLKGQAETMVRIERPLNLLLEHHLKRDSR